MHDLAPCHITTLITIYATPEIPNEASARDLEKYGLVIKFSKTGNIDRKWVLTDKGEKWLKMLLETPLPEFEWTDPRNRK